MCDVSAQGVDECMVNVHYYYCNVNQDGECYPQFNKSYNIMYTSTLFSPLPPVKVTLTGRSVGLAVV